LKSFAFSSLSANCLSTSATAALRWIFAQEIGDLVLFHPETAELLFSIGLHCLGCPSSGVETVSEAAEVHGLDADELVSRLNAIIKK